MKRIILLSGWLILLACSKDPVPVPTIIISGTVSVKDASNLIDDETINVGVFSGSSSSPAYSVELPVSAQSENVTFTLEGVPEGNYECKVYVAGTRKPFKYGLYTYSQSDFTSDVELSESTVKLVTYQRVQEQVFSACIMCHGGSNGAEAGLYLTEDKSYAAIVNKTSSIDSTEVIVKPDEAAASFMVKVLRQTVDVEHDYSSTISESDIQLIEKWIDNGATNP